VDGEARKFAGFDDAVKELAERVGVDGMAGGAEGRPTLLAAGESLALEAHTPGTQLVEGCVVEVDAAAAGAGLDQELDGSTWDALRGAGDREP
jgi:hypothetical protein